jgi:hypothetical protein
MSAVFDVFRMLFEPTAVFERVRERPRVLAPILVLGGILLVIAILMMPYTRGVTEAAIQVQMQARGATGAPPNIQMWQWVGVISQPIALTVILLVGASVLWMLTSLVGGEGKFMTLWSVFAYSSVWYLIQTAVTLAVIMVKGKENIQSMQDLQPALGLDLLFPDAKGFVSYLFKGINPFSLFLYWTTGLGVSVTHKQSRGTGYTIAFLAFAVMLIVIAGLAITCAPKTTS